MTVASGTPAAAPPGRPRGRGALAYPQFRWYLAGNFFSSSALWLRSLAQGWLVVELTDSSLWLGIIGFLSAFPTLLLTPLGGALADRLDRRILLMLSNAGLAITFLLVAVLVQLGVITIVIFAVFITFSAVLVAFDQPTRQAAVANLVDGEDVVSAIAVNSANFSVARVAGPFIGGILVPIFGIASGFYLITAGYVVFVTALVAIRFRRQERTPAGNVLGHMRDGFVYAARQRTILGLMLMSVAVNVFAGPIMLLLPQFVNQDLGGGVTELGFLLASAGVAAFVASILMAVMPSGWANSTVSAIFAMIGLVLIVALCLAPNIWWALVFMVGQSLVMQVHYTLNTSLLQLSAPDGMRGRVMSIFTLTWQFGALAALPLGALADVIGVGIAMAGWSALALLAVAAIQFLVPEVRTTPAPYATPAG